MELSAPLAQRHSFILLSKLKYTGVQRAAKSSIATEAIMDNLRSVSFLSPTKDNFSICDSERVESDDSHTLGPYEDTYSWASSATSLLRENVEYRHGRLVGATLSVLVKRMTPVNPPVDPTLSKVFFLTFRHFSTPKDLANALTDRYSLTPPANLSQGDYDYWQREIGIPIRRQVYKVINTWLEVYWLPEVDEPALPILKALLSRRMKRDTSSWSAHMAKNMLHKRTPSDATTIIDPTLSNPGFFINNLLGNERQPIRMSNRLRSRLRKGKFKRISIRDFNALELARQLTILESELFCAVRPEDILRTGADEAPSPKSIQAINQFATILTRWVTTSIITKRYYFAARASMIKFFVQVAYPVYLDTELCDAKQLEYLMLYTGCTGLKSSLQIEMGL
uniref:N-terminal Ras-GEF domain-containing protein n=1 Tax=Psilocybe cubensis TaxID=181762 RepID=A0A8H7XUU2_PSICU